jgi:hypothetical protein
MPTYIKTGYWDKKAKAPDGWLDLNLFVQTLIPPTPPPTPSTNIYNSDGTLTGNRVLNGNNNNTLRFENLIDFRVENNTLIRHILQIASGNVSGGYNILIDDPANNTKIGQRVVYNPSQKNLEIGSFNSSNQLNVGLLFENTGSIVAKYNNFEKGIRLDFLNNIYQYGQLSGGNATTLKIDDAAAFPVQVSGTNVTQNTSGAASGKFLKIKVDGVDYVIELKNPS